jgi:hypothetical protein
MVVAAPLRLANHVVTSGLVGIAGRRQGTREMKSLIPSAMSRTTSTLRSNVVGLCAASFLVAAQLKTFFESVPW